MRSETWTRAVSKLEAWGRWGCWEFLTDHSAAYCWTVAIWQIRAGTANGRLALELSYSSDSSGITHYLHPAGAAAAGVQWGGNTDSSVTLAGDQRPHTQQHNTHTRLWHIFGLSKRKYLWFSCFFHTAIHNTRLNLYWYFKCFLCEHFSLHIVYHSVSVYKVPTNRQTSVSILNVWTRAWPILIFWY